MKPTQFAELIANIKGTFVSFFSIAMFVALGVGIFVGISWSGPALQTAADAKYVEGDFHNYQVQFPYGLTEDDVAGLAAVEGVTDVEAVRSSFQTLVVSGSRKIVKVQSVCSRIDAPLDVEGALPAAPDEIVLEKAWADSVGIAVGDQVTFEHDGTATVDATSTEEASDGSTADSSDSSQASEGANKSGMAYLMSDTFRVVGLAESAEYLSTASVTFGFSNIGSGGIDDIAWVTPEAFDASKFYDGYPVVNVRAESLDAHSTFSSAYDDASAAIENRITALGESRADERYTSLHDKLQKAVDDGEKKLADAKKELADGEKKLADTEKQIKEGRETIDKVKEQVAEGKKKLEESRPMLDEMQAKYEEGKRLYDEKTAELRSAQAKYNKAVSALNAASEELTGLANSVNKQRSRQAKAVTAFDKAAAALQTDLNAGKITQAEYDKAIKAAEKTRDKAIAASNKKIDAACKTATKSIEGATGKKLPQALNHDTVDDAIEAASALLADYENMEIDYNGQTMTVKQARKKLEDGWAEAEAGAQKLSEGADKLQSGWDEYSAGVEKVKEGEEKVVEGEEKIKQAIDEVEKGSKKVEDGRTAIANKTKELDDAKQRLANMGDHAWNVLPRSYNGGDQSISSFSGVTERLRYSMAALFVIVGLLVCYSAVSRLVHEQITQIGTKKALGLRGREITLSFLAYSGLAVICGSIIGILVGVLVVEPIIGHALGARFIMGEYPPYFDWALAIGATAVGFVLVIAATWFACRSILKENAVELLRGEKPPTGKTRFFEKWAVWDKLPLYTQTIINNCLNDKRRVFGTVVGVAGCTALIVTAITLNNDVLASYDKQYRDVFGFDAIAYVDTGEPGAQDGVVSALSAMECGSAPVMRSTMQVKFANGDHAPSAVTVPADEEVFDDFYRLNSAGSVVEDLTEEGIWVAEACRTHRGARVGDLVEITDAQGVRHSLPIVGFFEYYLTNNEIVMSPVLYEREFSGAPVLNAVLAYKNGHSTADVEAALSDVRGFQVLVDDKEVNAVNFRDFSNVSRTVVLVYLALSVLMAIVVLLNLNIMFIDEKKRDLITLMINGFSVKDAQRYIYNDTIALTVIGIIAGLVLGGVMGSLTVASVEPETAYFVKGVDWVAMAVGALGSAVLAFAMSAIALRRIPRFNLTDINKM